MPAVLLATCALTRAAGTDHAYELLRRIRSPVQLARGCMARRYRVAVDVQGAMADRIRATLADQGLEQPVFEEAMLQPGTFSFGLANESYTLDTRELVSGILNPVDMIEVVLRSLVRFSSADTFELLKKQTVAGVQAVEGVAHVVSIVLEPREQRFCYAYQDLGTHVTENWLVRLEAVVDTAENLLNRLTVDRRHRTYAIEEAVPPPLRSVTARYTFGYSDMQRCMLPSLLQLSLNDTPAVAISARYRTEEGHVVFDRREICNTYEGGEPVCLEMTYGRYRFGGAASAGDRKQEPSKATRSIEEAAELAREAAGRMRSGDIRGAFRLYKQLADRYGQTPQGAEARALLKGVPDGL